MADYLVELKPSGKTQRFPEGTVLAEALFDMGAMLETPCGGKGTCKTCRVRVVGSVTDMDGRKTGEQTTHPKWCLSCRSCIASDLTVYIDETAVTRERTYPRLDSSGTYGIAVDVGTTTLRISLMDCIHKRAYEIDTVLNPQRRFGHDVISRIAAAADKEVCAALTGGIRKAVFSRVIPALHAMGLNPECITRIILSGNTTMLYLFFGIDVAPLGRFPYDAGEKNLCHKTPDDIGAGQFAAARICALPLHSAFLGADLVGGLALCAEQGFTENTFFIDLGTNGELFLIDGQGSIFAASCAMGPALEGMNISWGMTAAPGAITRITRGDAGLAFDMMGEGSPVGITGPALIDIISIVLDDGIILKDGAYAPDLEGKSLPDPLVCRFDNSVRKLVMWSGIELTQKDIRNVQLAKAASLAASRLLLEEAGCAADQIEHVIIAGAFGEHLDLAHFAGLGFLPRFSKATHHFLGDTSLKAALRACCDERFMERAALLRNRITEVGLSRKTAFSTEFIASLNFPSRTGT